jgi:hypothetical protein
VNAVFSAGERKHDRGKPTLFRRNTHAEIIVSSTQFGISKKGETSVAIWTKSQPTTAYATPTFVNVAPFQIGKEVMRIHGLVF